MSVSKIKIVNVFDDHTVQVEAISFWKNLNALPKSVNPIERANQLVLLAREEGSVIGLTTAHRVTMKSLNNKPFFNFRVLIHPQYRIPGLVDKMCVESRDFLATLFNSKASDCIGMVTLSENKELVQNRNEAVWPSSGFTFIGNSKAGFPIRILYFKNAKI